MWDRTVLIAIFVALTLTLTGCVDDDYNGGGGSGGGDYDTYWGIVETISVDGDVTNMTQKPESPAPRSDQEDCPYVMVLLILTVALAVAGAANDRRYFGQRI